MTADALPLLLAVVAAFGTAAFVAVRGQRSARATLLVAVCLALGGWLSCLLVAFGWFDVRFARLSVLFSTLSVVIFPHFAATMAAPPETPVWARWRWLLPSYLVAVVFAGLVLWTHWIWDDMGFVDGRYFETYGPGMAIFVPFAVGGLGAALVLLARAAKRASGVDRLRLHWVLFGIGGTILGCITTNLILPVVGVQEAMVLGPASTLFLFVCTAVAVVRFQLMGIHTVVHRTATWLVVSALAMAPVAALLVAFQPWLAGLDEPRFAGVVFVAFVAFQALARRLQPPVDRWFGRGFHRRADSVRLLVESLAHLGEPAALSERVLQTVALFEPQSAGVWVLSPGEGAFRRVGVLGDLACPATFPAHPPLAPAAGVFECDAGTRLGGLLPEGHGLALAVPLVAANRVVGLLGLGPRRTLQP